MSQYWSKLTASLVPYVPGEQPKDKKYIKLNTNENPYPPSPRVIDAIKRAANDDLRLYPDPTAEALRETIAGYHGVDLNQVFIGNGSDEILAFAFPAFFTPGRAILFPDITYSFYPVYAKLYGVSYETVQLDEGFKIKPESLFVPNGGVIFPNPNAPTGQMLTLNALREILNGNRDRVVIIDEAYIDFGGESAVRLIPEYDNLLVVQTLSKSRSLAGLRVGFAIGHEDLIEGLNRIKNSFNSYTLDRLALAGAVAAFEDQAYFEETTRKVISTREATVTQLERLGFHVIESKANFILISHPAKPAEQLFTELKQNGILVRYFNQPRINNYLRVSIGTDEEMETFVCVLAQILS